MAVMLVACSGAPAETQDDESDGGAGAGSTIAPVETTQGGNGEITGGGTGEIHIDIGGPLEVTVDMPFFAAGSRFAGDVAGVNLNFADEGGAGIATITGVSDGVYAIGYVGDEGGFSAQTCTLTDWSIGAASASGSFDCTEGFATTMDGTYLSGITMQGSFDASP